MSILELKKELDNNKVTANDLFEESRSNALKYQSDYNSFVTILDNFEEKKTDSILCGIPYALKDNLSTKGILTTASSNILSDYVPVYDATVYKKLKDKGAVLVGKTVMDELAMGGTGTTGHTGIVRNPWNKERMIGGSSAGSAAAVSLGIVPFALGSDTGDSIRKPAAYGGVVGFKPTYGLLSRYGLFAFASSMDHLGCFTKNVKDSAIVINELKGYDENDLTSLPDDNNDLVDLLNQDIKGKKGFYIKEIVDSIKDKKEIMDNFKMVLDKFKKIGIEVEEISIEKKLLSAIYPSYITISCAEATSNNANLTGILFGPHYDNVDVNKMIFDARTNGFSELIKRRFVIGSYVLFKENQEKLYLNACRIRRMIVNTINNLFDKYDFLIMPAAGDIAPKFEDATDKLSDSYLLMESHLAIANFGGMPSITIPSGFINDMPIGINITTKAKSDDLTLALAYNIEQQLSFSDQIAKGVK